MGTYPAQTWNNSESVSSRQGSAVSNRMLHSNVRSCQSPAAPLCQPPSTRRATLTSQQVRPSGVLCRWSDGLELTAWSPPLRYSTRCSVRCTMCYTQDILMVLRCGTILTLHYRRIYICRYKCFQYSTPTYPHVSLRSVFLIFSSICCWLSPMYAMPTGRTHSRIASPHLRTW